MINKYHINIFIIILSFFIISCNDDNSPISPIIQQNSLTGQWEEYFYGFPDFEWFIGYPGISKADSIIRIANLRMEKDSFQVIVDQTYFLNDTIFIENQKELRGTYKIKNDSIVTFIDSLNVNEDYLFKLKENILRLNYYIPKPDSTIVWVPPGVGLPWGRCLLKHGGELTRVE
jgi:hypothetical protein